MKNKQKTLCEEVKHHDYELITHYDEYHHPIYVVLVCKRCGDVKKVIIK